MLQLVKRKIHNVFHPLVGEIWMLHRVVEVRSEDKNKRDLEVTVNYLETLIKEYQEKGYRFVSLDEMYEDIVSQRIYRKKTLYVSITFDDGYADNYEYAYPLLKKLNIPFTIYVTTGFIDNELNMWWYPSEKLALTTLQIKELDANPLCTIGAHTMTHPKLAELSLEEQRREIIGSKRVLEKLLGHKVDHFSYPHGSHNEVSLQVVKEIGFKTITIAWGGTIRVGDDVTRLNRRWII